MLDYTLDIQPLEDAGVTDDVIAAHVSTRTMQALPCSEARVILQESNAVFEDPVAGTRAGSLIDHYSGLPEGEEKSLLGWFISHVFGSGETVTTDRYPRSIQLATLVEGLPSDLEQLADAMIALGGGQPDAGTTATTVSNVRDAYFANEAMAQRQLVADQKFNEFMSPVLNDVAATDADIASALVDWSNSYTE